MGPKIKIISDQSTSAMYVLGVSENGMVQLTLFEQYAKPQSVENINKVYKRLLNFKTLRNDGEWIWIKSNIPLTFFL